MITLCNWLILQFLHQIMISSSGVLQRRVLFFVQPVRCIVVCGIETVMCTPVFGKPVQIRVVCKRIVCSRAVWVSGGSLQTPTILCNSPLFYPQHTSYHTLLLSAHRVKLFSPVHLHLVHKVRSSVCECKRSWYLQNQTEKSFWSYLQSAVRRDLQQVVSRYKYRYKYKWIAGIYRAGQSALQRYL